MTDKCLPESVCSHSSYLTISPSKLLRKTCKYNNMGRLQGTDETTYDLNPMTNPTNAVLAC